jgi:hypothetical protein
MKPGPTRRFRMFVDERFIETRTEMRRNLHVVVCET